LTFALICELIYGISSAACEQTLDLWEKAVYSSSTPNSGNSLNIHNYIRAETDTQFRNWADLGAFAKFYHFRNVVHLDQQVVIRMNLPLFTLLYKKMVRV
jgi:hypothetical protein